VDTAIAAGLSDDVRNLNGSVWLFCTASDDSVVVDPYQIIDSELDFQTFGAEPDGTTSIEITAHSGFFTLNRGVEEAWTPENQKLTYPTDTGLDQIPGTTESGFKMGSDVRAALEKAVLAAMEQSGRDVMQWGKDDCALWCAGILRDALGYDPAAAMRGRYRTRRGAARVMGRKGMLGVARRAARRHKWKRIDPAQAQPGDVGLVWAETDKGTATLAAAICRAPGWFVARNERGFTAMQAKDVAGAWSVLDDCGPGARANLRRVSARPTMVPTSAAAHVPVAAFIAEALVSSFAISAGTAAVIGSIVTSAALSIGLSLAASLLMPQRGVGIDPNLSGSNARAVQITERQSIPFKRKIVGSAFVGGAMFFEQVENPLLTMGILINDGEIDGFEKVLIGTNELRFASLTPGSVLTPIAVTGQPDYPSKVRLSIRSGTASQAVDPLILQEYPNIGSEFRQRGIATAVLRYSFGADAEEFVRLWGQVQRPNAYFVVRGVRVYDPRDPTQSSTTRRRGNGHAMRRSCRRIT
jgi:hypothetical protein